MGEQTTEVPERELEIVHPPDNGLELNQAKFDAILRFSEQTEKVGRALDNIRKFALGRALPGDWVQHGENINPTGPGADRILSALGLMGVEATFTNWRYWKDTGTDKNGEWFVWWYEADVQIGGLRVEKVQGRAGSRDKFFGYKSGAWKDLADVKETDIRIAARRGVIKEAVKLALGLRSIPASSAASLGLNATSIKKVEFGQDGESAQTAAPAGTVVGIKDVKAFKGKNKKTGNDYVRYDVIDDKDAKYSTFDEKLAEQGRIAKETGAKVKLDYAVGKFGNELKAIHETATAGDGGEAEPA